MPLFIIAGAMAPLCPDNSLEFGMKTSWKGTERAAPIPIVQMGRWKREKRQVSLAKQKAVVQYCGPCLTCGLCLLSPRPSKSPQKPTASRSICRKARPSSGKRSRQGSWVCSMGCPSASKTPSTARYCQRDTVGILTSLWFELWWQGEV